MLYQLLKTKIENIRALLTEVSKYERERTERIKSKIYDSLSKIESY